MVLRPVGIDLFSGAGGMSLGFEQAGFDVKVAVEIDPIHAAVHSYNFPTCTTIPRSVSDLSGDMILSAGGLQNRPVDVIFGGAPCQGFSLIGQRSLDDPRNNLVKDFVRLVAEIQPKYFVFENVKGLTIGKHKQFLEEIIEAFKGIGYQMVAPWQILNACNYGVPQKRERLFLIGAKQGQSIPSYPLPETYPDPLVKPLAGHRKTPTCSEAIGDLPNAEKFESLLKQDSVKTHSWGDPSEYAKVLRSLHHDQWLYGYPRQWDPLLLTSSMRTNHTEISRHRFAVTKPGEVEPISRFFKLDRDGLCNTLRAGTDAARGAFTSPRPIHFSFPRCITVREMARLHGFPDWFRFHVTKWHGARQIGNAVPPPLARIVASQIIQALGISPTMPDALLELGAESLLTLDMKSASRFWGVEVPIARRDRRSGAKKRKQSEIKVFSG